MKLKCFNVQLTTKDGIVTKGVVAPDLKSAIAEAEKNVPGAEIFNATMQVGQVDYIVSVSE